MPGGFDSTTPAKAIPFDINTAGALGKMFSTNAQDALEELWNRTVTNLLSAEVSATADTTTTSAVDVRINGMVNTSPPAGVYLVWFDTTVDHSNQSVPITVSIYVGGVQVAASVRSVITRTNALGANSCTACISTRAKVTVNGSQDIEVKWNRGNAGTATAHQRTFSGLRVND